MVTATGFELIEKQGYTCLSCEAFVSDPGPALYECGECGSTFNRDIGGGKGNMCTNCNKTSSKVADQSCPECQEGELDTFVGLLCNFCEAEAVIPEDDFAEHLTDNHGEELADFYLANVTRAERE